MCKIHRFLRRAQLSKNERMHRAERKTEPRTQVRPDELAGWHHRLNGLGVWSQRWGGEGQGKPGVLPPPWGGKELDTTERLEPMFWKQSRLWFSVMQLPPLPPRASALTWGEFRGRWADGAWGGNLVWARRGTWPSLHCASWTLSNLRLFYFITDGLSLSWNKSVLKQTWVRARGMQKSSQARPVSVKP